VKTAPRYAFGGRPVTKDRGGTWSRDEIETLIGRVGQDSKDSARRSEGDRLRRILDKDGDSFLIDKYHATLIYSKTSLKLNKILKIRGQIDL
jgi:hypothetical protein